MTDSLQKLDADFRGKKETPEKDAIMTINTAYTKEQGKTNYIRCFEVF